MEGCTRRGNLANLGAGRLLLLAAALGVLAVPGGCSRRFYRKQADKEAAEVLAEKDQVPAWKIEQYHVYPDPRARFADPTNPDRPPMPPDDPGAHDFSPNPQKPGHAGIAKVEGQAYLDLLAAWDQENRAARAAQQAADAAARPETAPPGPNQPDAAPATA